MDKVDIVVTYLNQRDEKWQEDYNYWKNKEIEEGKASPNNRQAFGEERIREWDTLKYWFRGVEENCPWVNKVFLVVQNERHIPEWLKRDHPKLRIVYHDEFIPKELLPTFNAMTIGVYEPNIKDLSNHYLMCDDDFYFLNPIKENRFFVYGRPAHQKNRVPYRYYEGGYLTGTDRVFYQILNNNLRFEEKFMRNKIKYGFYHLPEARSKNFEKKILDQYAEEILEHHNKSRFRHETNLCSNVWSDLARICGEAWYQDPYYNCAYCDLKSTVNFDDYINKDIVCFNDTERLDDYDKTKEKLIAFFEKKFPNKSSYEKE